jgi:hypothetical protein
MRRGPCVFLLGNQGLIRKPSPSANVFDGWSLRKAFCQHCCLAFTSLGLEKTTLAPFVTRLRYWVTTHRVILLIHGSVDDNLLIWFQLEENRVIHEARVMVEVEVSESGIVKNA